MAWQRSVGPVLVLGAGDVGSAVGHALFRAGVAVALHDGPAPPAAPRRGMAFADTFFDGQARLAGVTARRLARLADLPAAIDEAAFLPFLAGTAAEALAAAPWAAVVDARMRKRAAPEDLRAWAPLAVGLGPGFVAGDGPEANCHAAVETSWEALGEVVRSGPTLPLRGEPRPIAGVGRERAVYAPAAGLFRTGHAIGGRIAAAEPIGTPATGSRATRTRVPSARETRGPAHPPATARLEHRHGQSPSRRTPARRSGGRPFQGRPGVAGRPAGAG